MRKIGAIVRNFILICRSFVHQRHLYNHLLPSLSTLLPVTTAPISSAYLKHLLPITFNFPHVYSMTERLMVILTEKCWVILSRPLCWVPGWRRVDDWRAICGITYSEDGVGKRGPLKTKSLNTRPHTHGNKRKLVQHEHTHTHTWIHIQAVDYDGDYGSMAVKQAETDQSYTL